jgi:hypothetical protein
MPPEGVHSQTVSTVSTGSAKLRPRFLADDWLLIFERGENYNSIGKLVVVEDPEIDRIMAQVLVDRDKGFIPLVDVDHKGGEAAGWICQLRKTDRGLEGFVSWTPVGERLVFDGIYRFLSPGFFDVELREYPGRVHPTQLDHASLTNKPGLVRIPITRLEWPDGTGPSNA